MPAALPILGNIAINLAVGVGLSLLSGIIAPQQSSASSSSASTGISTSMTVGENSPVSAVFGRALAGGNLIYINSYGDNDEYAQFVIDFGLGRHQGLHALLADGVIVPLAGSNSDPMGQSVGGKFTVSGTPYLWVKYYTGAPGQSADAELIANANPTGRWTSAHKLTGHAYLIITLRYEADVYSDNLPQFSAVWDGLCLYDWRKDSTVAGGSGSHRWGNVATYEWTDNPYVIRWNFRRGIFVNGVRVLGMGYPFFAQNLDYYTAAANLADESIYDPVTDTSFARYAYGRQIGDDEDRMSIMAEIDDCCCGTSCKIGGADAPLPGAQQSALLTLADSDRIAGAAVTADKWGLVSAKKTAWAGKYLSPDLNWQQTGYQTRINADLEGSIGGRRTQPLDQLYESLEPRAQMRAEIAARRQSFAATRTETFGPIARQLDVGDCITRSCSWGDVTMIVTRRALTDDRLGVTLDLAEWSNTIVPASGDSFVTEPPASGTGPADPTRLVAVSGADAEAYSEIGGGATHAAIRFSIDPITDQSVDSWYVRYWPSSGTDASDGKTLTGTRFNSALVTPGLAPLTEYSWYIGISTTPWRATVVTSTATVTTGAESIPVADGSVDSDQLALRMQALINFFKNLAADLQENVDRIASTQQDQDAANYVDKQQVVQQIGIAVASFSQELSLLADDNEATALLVQSLNAALGGNSAQVNVVWEAQAAPDGFAARYAIRCQADDGQLRQATLFIDVPADPNGKTRIGLSADETVFFASDGTPIALINGNGEIISANGAVYVNLFTGALRLTKV